MATVGSLVVDLVANTASFVAGMRTARSEVTNTAQAVRAAQGQLGSLSASVQGAGDVAASIKQATAGIEEAGAGAKQFASGLGDIATAGQDAADRVSAVRDAVSKLRDLMNSPVSKIGFWALVFGAGAKYAIDAETAAIDEKTKQDSKAPDTQFNVLGRYLEEQQRLANERVRKVGEFMALQPLKDLQSARIDVMAGRLDPAGAAALRVRESMKGLVATGQMTPADAERVAAERAGLAQEAAEQVRITNERADAEQYIAGLKKEAAVAGRTEVDSLEDQLRLRKLDGAQLQQALQLSRQIRGQNLAFNLAGQDPQTAFAREMQSIKDAVQFGGLSKDLAKDGIASATLRLAQSATQTPRAPSGLLFGSNQAFTAEGNKQNLSIDLVKQQLGIAQKSLTVQEAIAKGQAAVQAVGVFKIK